MDTLELDYRKRRDLNFRKMENAIARVRDFMFETLAAQGENADYDLRDLANMQQCIHEYCKSSIQLAELKYRQEQNK